MSLETGTWAGMNYTVEQEGDDYVCYLTGTQTEAASSSGCPFGSSGTYEITKVVCNNLKIINGYRFFYPADEVTTVEFGTNIDSSEMTSTREMFYHTDITTIIGIENLDLSAVTAMGSMFEGCWYLTTLGTLGPAPLVQTVSEMFLGCGELTSIDVSNLNLTRVKKYDGMFGSCNGLTAINLPQLNTTDVVSFESMFFGCTSLVNINMSAFTNTKPSSLYGMFRNCEKMTEIDLTMMDWSNVEDIDYCFNGCAALVNIIWPSNFTADNINSLRNTFCNCSSLTSIDLNHWNVQKVIFVDSLFQGCTSLSEVNIGTWDLQSCSDFQNMFDGCSSLQHIPTETWTMPQATNVTSMFADCASLVEILLPRWIPATTESCDTTKFAYGCTNLKRVILGYNKLMKREGWHFNTEDMIYTVSTPNVVSWDNIDGEDYRTYETTSSGSSGSGSLWPGLPGLPGGSLWPGISTETSINRTLTLENTSGSSDMKLLYKYGFETDDYIEVYNIDSDGVETLVLTLEGQGIDYDSDTYEAFLTEDSLDLTDCAAIKIVEYFASRSKDEAVSTDYGKYYGYYFILTDNTSVKNEQWTEHTSTLANAFATIDSGAFERCENLQFLQLNIPDAVKRGLSEDAAAHLVLAGEWFAEPLRLTRLHKIILR